MTGNNIKPSNGHGPHTTSDGNSNPTFSTRNQSKRKLLTLLMAATFLILLVSVVVLYKRHRREEMYKGSNDSRTQSSSSSSRGRSNRGGGGGNDLGFLSSKSQSNKGGDNVASESSDSESEHSGDGPEVDLKNRKPFYGDNSETEQSSVVQVPVNGGPVRGQTRKGQISGSGSESQREVTSFLGLPYAAAPVGELRFEPPEDARKWSTVKEAIYQPPKCPQVKAFFLFILLKSIKQKLNSFTFANSYVFAE